MTRREEIIKILKSENISAQALANRYKCELIEIIDDLEHIRRSIKPNKLHMKSAFCKKCGFVFAERSRIKAPSRCPKCKIIFYKKYHQLYNDTLSIKKREKRDTENPIIEVVCFECGGRFNRRQNNKVQVRCNKCVRKRWSVEYKKKHRKELNQKMMKWREKNPEREKANRERYLHSPRGRLRIKKDRDRRKREYGRISLIPDAGYSTKLYDGHHVREYILPNGERFVMPWIYPVLKDVHEEVRGSNPNHIYSINKLAGLGESYLDELIAKAKKTESWK